MSIVKVLLAAGLSTMISMALAGEIRPYSQQAFDKLTQGGKPVVVDVSATWCPTCKAQKPIVENLMKEPVYKDVTLLTVDFDADKPVLKRFNVTMQSTLVAFKGGKEVGRSTGDITAQGLKGLVQKTVQ